MKCCLDCKFYDCFANDGALGRCLHGDIQCIVNFDDVCEDFEYYESK